MAEKVKLKSGDGKTRYVLCGGIYKIKQGALRQFLRSALQGEPADLDACAEKVEAEPIDLSGLTPPEVQKLCDKLEKE